MFRSLLFLLAWVGLARAAQPPSWLVLPDAAATPPAHASAWVLFDGTRVTQKSDGHYVFRFRHATRVLRKSGIAAATPSVPFTTGSARLLYARGWVIAPDGRKCDAFGTGDFIVSTPIISSWSWDLSKLVTFDVSRRLEIGSTCVWELEIESDSAAFDVYWSPQSEQPTQRAVFEAIPLPGGAVKWHPSGGLDASPVNGGSGALSWQLSDLPGFDPNVPAGTDLQRPQLRVYFVSPEQDPRVAKTWTDVATLARNEIDPKARLTTDLASFAAEHVGVGSLWTRIAPICRFVQSEIPYLAINIAGDSMAGYRPHAASEVLANRYGDCKDKAVLLCSLLGALHVEAHVVLVTYGEPLHNDPAWPSASFNHAIVAIDCAEPAPAGWPVVTVAGRTCVLFDPTDERVPLGLLPDGDRYGEGLVLADGVTEPVRIPPSPTGRDSRNLVLEVKLAIDGSADVTLRETRTGIDAALAARSDDEQSHDERQAALERQVQQHVPLIDNLTWDSAVDTATGDWKLQSRFKAEYLGKRTSTSLYVSTDIVSVIPDFVPWESGTDGSATVGAKSLQRLVAITAPAGWEFADIPSDRIERAGPVDISLHYVRDGAVLRQTMTVNLAGGILDRAAYREMCRLLTLGIAADHRPVLLKATASPTPKA